MLGRIGSYGGQYGVANLPTPDWLKAIPGGDWYWQTTGNAGTAVRQAALSAGTSAGNVARDYAAGAGVIAGKLVNSPTAQAVAQYAQDTAHAAWCKLHPIDCFFEKRPWAKPLLIGGALLFAGLYVFAMFRVGRGGARFAKAHPELLALAGPEGAAVGSALASRRKNRRRRRRS